MSSPKYTLETLSTRAEDIRSASPKSAHSEAKSGWSSGLTMYAVLFVIVAVALYLLHPAIVTQTDQQGAKKTNWTNLILWSLGIAAALYIVFGFLKGSNACDLFKSK